MSQDARIPERRWCGKCRQEMMAFENPDKSITYVCVNRDCR